MPDLGPLAGVLLDLVGPAIRAMLKTTLGSLMLTAWVCVLAFYLASTSSTYGGVGAVVLTVIVGLGVTGFVAAKQAVTTALATALRRFALGSKMSRILFERILKVDGTDPHGERGTSVAVRMERVPLARAEELLQRATVTVLGSAATQSGFRGWLARRLHARAATLIEEVTLARFREDARQRGGVDLVQVRDWVSEAIDEQAVDMVESTALRVTVLVGLVAALLCLGVAIAIGRYA